MNINYDLSHMLGYIGILVTILIGVWGIYVTLKHRHSVRVSFILRKSIALFDTIVKNITELSVLYKGSPVTQNLILIEGALANTGNKDILPTMIERPISLNLPEDYKWITAKIISTSNNVEADISISDQTLTINSGLFKINEYIHFQALLQAPHDENIANLENNIDNNIKISHRIADLPKIESKMLHINIIEIFLLIFVILGFIAGILAILNVSSMNLTKQAVYYYEKPNNKIIKVTIKGLEGNFVTIEGVDIPFKETLRKEEFIKKSQKKEEVVHEIPLIVKVFGAICIIVIVAGFTFLAILIRGYRKDKKLSKIFNIE